jgi:hypothetical protein
MPRDDACGGQVFSSSLPKLAPDVYAFYLRFRLDNAVQRQIMRAVDSQGLSVLQASCEWLRTPANAERWQRWLQSDLSCAIGSYLANENTCQLCPEGSGSLGNMVTKCTQCAAGALSHLCPCASSAARLLRLASIVGPVLYQLCMCLSAQAISRTRRGSLVASAVTILATFTRSFQARRSVNLVQVTLRDI